MARFECNAWTQEMPSAHELQQLAAEVSGNATSKIEEPASTEEDLDLIGPGWYDSSWDLKRGLLVREGLPSDAMLHEWLASQLIGASMDEALCEMVA